MSVKVLADSTCDLSKELIERYGIGILPLHIVLGDKEYRDGEEIDVNEIYRWSDANKTTPKTSAVAVADAMEAYEKYQREFDEFVVFTISGKMSTTVNVMRMAAEELGIEERVCVVDSQNLSSGGGHLVIEAAILAGEGKSAREIAAYVQELRPRVRASFVVDTLTYLYRGGRCSGIAALAGSALKLHPKIIVTDGAMEPGKKYRGKLDKVILEYAEEMEPQLLKAKKDRVFITHSSCDPEIVGDVYRYLEGLHHFDEILVTRAGGVISSHCGPGTLGVLYIDGQ